MVERVERVVMDFQFFTLSPHMIEDALNLAKRWGSSIEVANDEVLMHICAFLEDRIMYQYPRPTISSTNDGS